MLLREDRVDGALTNDGRNRLPTRRAGRRPGRRRQCGADGGDVGASASGSAKARMLRPAAIATY
jgi:hypothetical protein